MHVVSHFSRKNRTRGGVLIMLKKEVSFIRLNDINSVAVESHFEITAIKISIFNLIIVCIYRPPNGDSHIFFNQLYLMLNCLKYNNARIIIGGDYNIHFNVQSGLTQNTVDAFRSYGLESIKPSQEKYSRSVLIRTMMA